MHSYVWTLNICDSRETMSALVQTLASGDANGESSTNGLEGSGAGGKISSDRPAPDSADGAAAMGEQALRAGATSGRSAEPASAVDSALAGAGYAAAVAGDPATQAHPIANTIVQVGCSWDG